MKKEQSPPFEAAFGDAFKNPPEKQDVMMSWPDRQVNNRVDSALWAAVNQVYVKGRGRKKQLFISHFIVKLAHKVLHGDKNKHE